MFGKSLPLALIILVASVFSQAQTQNLAQDYVNHGIVQAQKNDITGAISDFTKAIDLNPKLAEAFCNRGVARGLILDFDGALADFAKAIALNPNFDQAFYDRANLSYRRGEIDASLSDYSKAIELKSSRADYFFGRGLAYFQKKDYDRATADFSKAIKINSKYSDAYFGRARSLRLKGDLSGAVADYEKTIALAPTNALAYNGYAWLLATTQQDKFRNGQKAVEYARKACELTKWKDVRLLDTLAAAYAEAGDFDEAIKWEKKALEDPKFEQEQGVKAKQRLQSYSDHRAYRES